MLSIVFSNCKFLPLASYTFLLFTSLSQNKTVLHFSRHGPIYHFTYQEDPFFYHPLQWILCPNHYTKIALVKVTYNLFVTKQFISFYLIWILCHRFTLSTKLFFKLPLTSVRIPVGVGKRTGPNKTLINVSGIHFLLSSHLSGSSFNFLDSSSFTQLLNVHAPRILYTPSLGNLIYLLFYQVLS